MKVILAVLVALTAVAATGMDAQESNPKAALHVFADGFCGNEGCVAYPQYAWMAKTPVGTTSGYGFVEAAPHEPFFVNNLVIITPTAAPWFSVHSEIGGKPNLGLSFVQVGPRVNVTKAIPKLGKPMDHLFVTVLPRFEGIRPNNLLLAGATNPLKVTKDLSVSIEGYRRFFPHNGYYGEYWILAHPSKTPRLSWGMFILNDSSSTTSVGFGGRISLF